MNYVVLILLIIVFGIAAGGALIETVKAKREVKKLKQQEKQNAKIDKETLENINGIVDGDIHAGNDVLHQLAEKRK